MASCNGILPHHSRLRMPTKIGTGHSSLRDVLMDLLRSLDYHFWTIDQISNAAIVKLFRQKFLISGVLVNPYLVLKNIGFWTIITVESPFGRGDGVGL